jgi:hypothetical protein
MDDTTEILDRLERIGALAGAGAGRTELLHEVRGLLEARERTLVSEPVNCRDSSEVVGGSDPRKATVTSTSPAGRGREATVS